MESKESRLTNWTPEQIAQGKRWIEAWRIASAALEKIRREELRNLDGERAIAALCHDADYFQEPYAPKPTSGLVEQQRLFMKWHELNLHLK
jgi:hypothetical protein